MDNVMVQFLQLTVSFYRKTDVWKQFFFWKLLTYFGIKMVTKKQLSMNLLKKLQIL